jgi:hypothetical protein
MKRLTIFGFFLMFTFSLSAIEITDMKNVQFRGKSRVGVEASLKDAEGDYNYSIAYSPLLPAQGIYSAVDTVTGRETIIQVGYAEVPGDPYVLYLPDEMFSFFSDVYDTPVSEVQLQLRFLAWNKQGQEAEHLNIQSLIIQPEEVLDQIESNGDDKKYIQIGSFSYYQNAYPVITDLLPYLELRPEFYLVKSKIERDGETRTLYRILAGPYQLNDARQIVNKVNEQKKSSVFIRSSDTIKREITNGGGL